MGAFQGGTCHHELWMPPSSAVDWNGHKEDLSMFSFRRLDTYTIRNTAFDAMNINDNTVYIETTHGIVHTKWDCFKDIYIISLKKGEFKAKVTLMCAEYEDFEETEITFVCE